MVPAVAAETQPLDFVRAGSQAVNGAEVETVAKDTQVFGCQWAETLAAREKEVANVPVNARFLGVSRAEGQAEVSVDAVVATTRNHSPVPLEEDQEEVGEDAASATAKNPFQSFQVAQVEAKNVYHSQAEDQLATEGDVVCC